MIVFENASALDIVEGAENMLIRIDQNPPERINLIVATQSSAIISGGSTIKIFLGKVKDGRERLAMRIGNFTEEISLHSNISAAIEDFLSRTQNLPAFYIQD